MTCGAVDVHYPTAGGARAALVVAEDSRFATITGQHIAWLDHVAAYQPGQFFARELPAIAAVLAEATPLELVVIDGYVDLDPNGRPGLGAHLHELIGVAVIGVAKTAYRSATHAVQVHRAGRVRPLFVTSIGLPPAEATAIVSSMSGPHRIPDALRQADRLARLG